MAAALAERTALVALVAARDRDVAKRDAEIAALRSALSSGTT